MIQSKLINITHTKDQSLDKQYDVIYMIRFEFFTNNQTNALIPLREC